MSVHSPFGMRPRAPSRTGEVSPRTDRPEVPVLEAKCHLDASSVQVSNQGVRVMTIEDLSSTFFAFNGRLECTEGHGTSIYEAADFNALLVSETCKELIALKKVQAATEQQVAAAVVQMPCTGPCARRHAVRRHAAR